MFMDDSDTKLYKWWEHVDRKETFADISERVSSGKGGGNFASDKERIIECMDIISYLQNVADSDTSTNEEDDWHAISAIESILKHSALYQDYWENVWKKTKRTVEDDD